MPGSKAMKLAQGLPFSLALAEQIHQHKPNIKFILPVAPTFTLQRLSKFADPDQNPIIALVQGQTAQLQQIDEQPYFITPTGLKVKLITEFPAHNFLRQCCFVVTTVGANTAELGALNIPMIVLLPTQDITAMTAWDGLPGLIAKLPWLGPIFLKWFNRRFVSFLRNNQHFLAWPNIWAQRKIIPELVGDFTAEYITDIILDYLDHPEKLAAMRKELRELRGTTGAAAKLTEAIAHTLNIQDIQP